MENTYYLGLDMGSASLGWAVTDSEYHILKKHGESLWGVRLFDSASTAEERRTFRTSRRRLDRRNWRIQILQEIFAEEISKIDPGFFLRMKESKYYPEDKRDESGNCPELPYALFVDSGFTDKDFHREFPTIYHLRKWLMETEETPDIRLLYLAFHHMIKHRGHFLLSGDISKIKKFDSTFLTLLQNVAEEELDWNLEIDSAQISAIENILKNRNLTRSAKKSQLIRLSGAKTACEKAIFTLISGGTVKLSDIFGNDDLNESERPKISFSDSGYDDYIEAVTLTLGEQFYIIESAKAVYDWSVLADILGDSVSISAAKVKVYEKHKKDLMYLKKIVRSNLSKEDYKNIFVNTDAKLNNYCAYVGMTKKNGRKVSLAGKCCSQIEFYDFLKKNVLSKIDDTVIKEYLENEINCENFLPKQINKGNSVIPYQVHLFELKSILKNMEAKIPFIRENSDKIIQLFEFRIPYYVGPLCGESAGCRGKFSWAVRKSYDKIYPWNFNDVIDTESSAEVFIRKDAYLNIVVGNSYYVKFTQNAAWYIKENPGRTYNLEEMFKPKKRGRVARDIVRNGEIAWKAGEKGTIITVKKVMQKNNILVTRRSYEVKGGLFDQMIMKKGKGQIPIKSSDGRLLDINKYGGYNKATGAYFMLVKSRDKKGREIRSLEFVPLYLKNRIEQNEDAAIEYLEKDRGLKEPQIVLRKIRADTLFDVDGFKMWLSGRSGSQLIFKCANQLILSPNDEKCLKKILKFIQRRKENKNLQIYNVDGILEEDLLRLYDTFLDKLQNTMYKKRLSAQVITLTEKRNNFIKLRIEDKCIVLNEILHMFQSQSGCANLTLIGGPAKAGRIAMNSNITECKSISIINQSSSGIFEKKIDLLKL